MAAIESSPIAHAKPPQSRHLGEHIDAGTHILRTFRVMRAGRQHGVRPITEALLIREMKLGRRSSEAVKIASNIIQRDQAVVTVKSRIFHPFCHHRAGELLEFHGEGDDRISIGGILPFRNAE